MTGITFVQADWKNSDSQFSVKNLTISLQKILSMSFQFS